MEIFALKQRKCPFQTRILLCRKDVWHL